jgi:hypothetical protein
MPSQWDKLGDLPFVWGENGELRLREKTARDWLKTFDAVVGISGRQHYIPVADVLRHFGTKHATLAFVITESDFSKYVKVGRVKDDAVVMLYIPSIRLWVHVVPSHTATLFKSVCFRELILSILCAPKCTQRRDLMVLYDKLRGRFWDICTLVYSQLGLTDARLGVHSQTADESLMVPMSEKFNLRTGIRSPRTVDDLYGVDIDIPSPNGVSPAEAPEWLKVLLGRDSAPLAALQLVLGRALLGTWDGRPPIIALVAHEYQVACHAVREIATAFGGLSVRVQTPLSRAVYKMSNKGMLRSDYRVAYMNSDSYNVQGSFVYRDVWNGLVVGKCALVSAREACDWLLKCDLPILFPCDEDHSTFPGTLHHPRFVPVHLPAIPVPDLDTPIVATTASEVPAAKMHRVVHVMDVLAQPSMDKTQQLRQWIVEGAAMVLAAPPPDKHAPLATSPVLTQQLRHVSPKDEHAYKNAF